MSYKVLIPQLGPRGIAGAQMLQGTAAPEAEQGNNGDFFIRYGPEGDTQIYGPKSDGAWGSGRSIRGGQGPAGLRGWNPVLLPEPINVEVSEGVFEPRILVRLAAWIGGQGTAPTSHVGQYVNAAGDGFTEEEAEALDLRGDAGIDGVLSGMEIAIDDDAAIGAEHKGKNLVVAAADPVTLTLDEAAELGAGWMVLVFNDGPAAATIAADGEDTIEGESNIVLPAGQMSIVWVAGDLEGFRALRVSLNPTTVGQALIRAIDAAAARQVIGLDIASQAEMEAASAANRAVTAALQHFHLGHPKCVVKLTTLNTTPTITVLYNALGTLGASRVVQGEHSFSWTTSLAKPTAIVAVGQDTQFRLSQQKVTTATGTGFFTFNNAFGAVDPTEAIIVVWGDLP